MARPPNRDQNRRLSWDGPPPTDVPPPGRIAAFGAQLWDDLCAIVHRYRPQFQRNWRYVLAAIVLLITLVTGGKFLRPFIRGYTVSEELLTMDEKQRALAAENDARADELKYYTTPEGKKLLARRGGMMEPGEVLVKPVPRPQAVPSPTALTTQQVVQLWIAEWRQSAATGVHHSEAVVARWAVDPPEVKAAQKQARERHSKKAPRKQKQG